ncbi:MAG: DUF2231 domain-containing protein [Nocardiaceae bacterium]|nr:DUF2231 domain-containing protein [Nocardiaceae bacterium]
MESRVKLFGHAVHPMLIAFPLGLYTTSIVFDFIYLATNRSGFPPAAAYVIATGFIGGAAAAIVGWIDWFAIPRDTRARKVGLVHGTSMAVVNVLFLVSWLFRLQADNWHPASAAFAFSIVGFAIAGIGAWLGGELVERLSVSVDTGANLDAPNSLTHRHVTGTPATNVG